MKIYEITPNDYDVLPIGYVTDENEAIQFCLDGNHTYRELPKLEVSSEIMKKERFTLVEIVFRFRDNEWNSDDVRIYYSDKPFTEIANIHNLRSKWIKLQMILDKNKTIKSTKQSIYEQFNTMIEKVDSVKTYSDKINILKDFGISIIESRL